MKKKFLFLGVSLLSAFALASCGETENPGDKIDEKGDESQEKDTCEHKLSKLKAGLEPTYTRKGKIPYYQCQSCKKYFDENMNEIDKADITLDYLHFTGKVASLDANGNAVLNITNEDFKNAYKEENQLTVKVGNETIDLPFIHWEEEVDEGVVYVTTGDTGFVEFRVRGAKFNEKYTVAVDNAVDFVYRTSDLFESNIRAFRYRHSASPVTVYGKDIEVTYNKETDYDNYVAIGQAIIDDIKAGEKPYAELETAYDNFEDAYYSMLEQYRYAAIIYDTYPVKENNQKKDDCLELLNKFSELDEEIRLAAALSDTYKHDFYEDATDEEIAEYAASLNPDLSKQVNDIEREMDDYLEAYQEKEIKTSGDFGEAYLNYLRGAYEVGQIKGVNYLERAYSSTYGREYTVEDTNDLAPYFSNYIIPLYKYCKTEFEAFQEAAIAQANRGGGADYDAYEDLVAYAQSFYGIYFDYIEDYLKNEIGDELFDNFRHYYLSGNYFYSSKKNDYVTGYVGSLNATESVMFLGPRSQSVTTFIHEFGHYNAACEGGDNISYDLDEVHSQANELMFYNYLNNKVQSRGTKEFLNYQLYVMLDTVVRGFCINEMEKWAFFEDLNTYAKTYYQTYEEYNKAEGTTLTEDEFTALSNVSKIKEWNVEDFETAVQDKWTEITTNVGVAEMSTEIDYVHTVLVDYNGYYISYSTSALGALEVFAKSLEDKDAAISGYKMLYREHDSEVDTFTSCLIEAGFYGVFDEECYKLIGKIKTYLEA